MQRKILYGTLLFLLLANVLLGKVNTKANALYVFALGEYIKATYGAAELPDTLFVGKNADMPKIELPANINGINVLLVSSDEAKKKLRYRNTLVYINIVGWIDKSSAEFILVKFHEFQPIHNCHINLKYTKKKEILLDSIRFEYPYGKNLK